MVRSWPFGSICLPVLSRRSSPCSTTHIRVVTEGRGITQERASAFDLGTTLKEIELSVHPATFKRSSSLLAPIAALELRRACVWPLALTSSASAR